MSAPARRLALGALALAVACGDGGTGPDNSALLDIGGVRPITSGTSLTAKGGDAGADYLLAAFYGSESAASNVSLTVTPSNVGSVPAEAAVLPSGVQPLFSRTAGNSLSQATSRSFERQLRAREAALESRFGAARQWLASRSRPSTPGLSMAALPSNPQVGDLIDVNVSLGGCSDPTDIRQGRIAAITQRAIVVADVDNPTGGYTDAEYQSVGVTFDTLVAAVDEGAFGQPADMDGNGKVMMFFTQAVNELTPRGDDAVVGGFFYARDLFPKVTTNGLEGCNSSNETEMFYLLVPDPTGVVSDPRSKSYVLDQVIATTGHEYQHLINASRRLYVNTTATSFEITWLNEGLSHIAEELIYYKVSGHAPRQNLDGNALRASQAQLDAFNEFQNFNFGRYRTYLERPTNSSPWASDDSLQTRGAIWAMLRYLADHKGTSGDGTVWKDMDNSTVRGMATLKAAFGTDVMNQIRDWATSIYTDDIPLAAAPDAAYQEPSWNFRSIYPLYRDGNGNSIPSPLPPPSTGLTDGQAQTKTIRGGGVAYYRFSVRPNETGTISWSNGGTVPAELKVSLIRLR